MPLSSQFSLSVELTRLAPLALAASSKAAEALMALARDLRNSGSDILIEEDLVAMFGRCHIESNLDRSFRTVVAKSGVSHLCEAISLSKGPGPTVVRGLQQKPYFAMVVQCSMLTWVHERSSLAATLAGIFEMENEDTPAGDMLKAAPSQEGVKGVLKACEEQTCAFDWSAYIRAVAGMLSLSESRAFQPLPAVIVRGAMYMFPLVQSLPEARFISIELNRGVCILVVWAHSVLGLTVVVSIKKNNPSQDVVKKFGSGNEQVFIEMNSSKIIPSIALLETVSREEFIKLHPASDEREIEGIVKQPAQGFGNTILRPVTVLQGREAVIEEVKLISCAFASIIAENIAMASSTEISHMLENPDDDVVPKGLLLAEATMKCQVSEESIIDAARLLFDDSALNRDIVRKYADIYSKRPLTPNLDPNLEVPRPIQSVLNRIESLSENQRVQFWHYLLSTARLLAVVILAFAHIVDLSKCREVLLCNILAVLEDHVLISQLQTWNGKTQLRLPEDVWFHAIALLMIGHKDDMDRRSFSSVCLVSDRGWSVYLANWGIADPSLVSPGFVKVELGVPTRNKIRKSKVVDGPRGQFDTGWGFEDVARGEVSINASDSIVLGKPLCGDHGDSFVVNLRTVLQKDDTSDIRRTGYREQSWALWMVARTSPCEHYPRVKERLILPVNCVGVTGFWEWDPNDLNEKVVVALTARSSAARWRALVAAAHGRFRDSGLRKHGLKHVLLRDPGCCVECALDQGLMLDGRCVIIM